MTKYMSITKIYLIFLSIFVVLRFVLEAFGVSGGVTSEISVTRLYIFLPIFLGIRFAKENLGGLKDMLLANLTYFLWGTLLVALAAGAEAALDAGTHYVYVGLGGILGTLVVGTIVLTIICWITAAINRKLS